MNIAKRWLVSLLLVCSFVVAAGPVGCGNTTLSAGGIYQQDKFLYNAEKTIVTAYKSFDAFLKWEETYRAVLPAEVSRSADVIRANAKKWIDTAHSFRDVYVQNPTSENRDKLKLTLDLIDTALAEATKYLTQYRTLGVGGTGGDVPTRQ